QQQSGAKVDAKDIKKHRNDVARLLQLLSPESRVELPGGVTEDMRVFLEMLSVEADFDPKQFNVNYTRDEVVTRLQTAYQL
ncbi:MAG: hypothetical protein ABL931_07445, partial [Usitatibacteraceae bacterium]